MNISFTEFFTFLQTPFGYFALFISIIFITHIFVKIFNYILDTQFKHPHFFKQNRTQHAIIKHFVTAFLYLIGTGVAIYIHPSLRTLAVSLFAGAGVIAIIFGFASQAAFSNIVSGLFIAIFTPFRVGDQIKIREEVFGVVEDINLRHTTIRTYDNKRIVIPNSIINSETIMNYNIHDQKICEYIEVSVSYDSDLEKALKLLAKAAEEHPDCIDVRSPEQIRDNHPKVVARAIEFEESGIKLRASAWALEPRIAFLMHCDLRREIKKSFDKNNIEIPYPHRSVVIKKDHRDSIKPKPKRKVSLKRKR